MNIALMSMLSRRRSTGVGGGHVRSLAETACALAKKHNVFVVEQGNFFPSLVKKTIEDAGASFVHIPMSFASAYTTPVCLRDFFRFANIDLVSCMGQHSDIFPYLALESSNDTPFIVTKCGGFNSPHYAHATNLVVYSRENLRYYRDAGVPNVAYYPNRAARVITDAAGVAHIKKQCPNSILMRICRIDGTYDYTVLQGARLARELARTTDLHYVVIGKANTAARLQQLRQATLDIYPHTLFFNEPQFTANAAELLDAATFVLGTGRGFMEAASVRKLMFCPVQGSALPMFVDQKSYDDAFESNFSGRMGFSNCEIHSSLLRCTSIVGTAGAREQYGEWIESKFRNDFCSDILPGAYEQLRESALPVKRMPTKTTIYRIYKAYKYCYIPTGFSPRPLLRTIASRLRARD